MSVKRTKLLIANWKLNHTRKSARDFFDKVLSHVNGMSAELAVAPVAPMLDFIGTIITNKPIALCAQNVFYEDKGAFTGEWSVAHLYELGVTYCLIGHSERRRIFFETDDDVAKKVKACLVGSLTPVICVGESLHERETKQTFSIIERQTEKIMELVEIRSGPVILAYEPLWAIGTGQVATIEQIKEVFAFIRALWQRKLGDGLANAVRILYGGSVTAQNIGEIVAAPDVDGALVGGASLQAESFLSMVEKLRA
jgi:triosephosphate isomerase